jgi:hypothetical protein
MSIYFCPLLLALPRCFATPNPSVGRISSNVMLTTRCDPTPGCADVAPMAMAGTGSLSNPIISTLSRLPRRPMPPAPPYGLVPLDREPLPIDATALGSSIAPVGGSRSDEGLGESGAEEAWAGYEAGSG